MIRHGREGKHMSIVIPPKFPAPDRTSHTMRAIVRREYGTPDVLAADDEVRRIYLGTEFRLD